MLQIGDDVSLCLATAGVVKSLAMASLMLTWTHSVEKIEWQEDWRVMPRGLEVAEAGSKDPDTATAPPPEAAPKALDAKTLLARGDDFNVKGELDRAIADYDAALKVEPTLVEALNGRGTAWRAKGDRRRALSDFDAALKLKPDFEAARANRKSLFSEIERAGAQMPLKGKDVGK